jgi:hypothetical protein
VNLFPGNAQIGTTKTQDGGGYRFTMPPLGAYTVVEVNPGWHEFSSTPDRVPVIVSRGQASVVNFGDGNGRPSYLPLILR